jgi:hypothetical protein
VLSNLVSENKDSRKEVLKQNTLSVITQLMKCSMTLTHEDLLERMIWFLEGALKKIGEEYDDQVEGLVPFLV